MCAALGRSDRYRRRSEGRLCSADGSVVGCWFGLLGHGVGLSPKALPSGDSRC